MQTRFGFLVIVAILILSCVVVTVVYGEVDKTCSVARVIDGDTFILHSGETVRLADIDCPEFNEYGYSEATDYLKDLINGKFVSLDIDDFFWTDKYGRLVCVAYVGFNKTHWINVNKALLDGEYASITDCDNEFSPYSWTYYSEQIRYPKTSSPYIPLTPQVQPTPLYSPSFLTTMLETLVASAILFLVIIGVIFMVKRTKRQ